MMHIQRFNIFKIIGETLMHLQTTILVYIQLHTVVSQPVFEIIHTFLPRLLQFLSPLLQQLWIRRHICE